MTATHDIPAADFIALAAAGGSPGSITNLRAGQFSKNALALRAILEIARRQHKSAGFENGYDVLAAIQQPTVAAVLAHPQVGSWVCECRRALEDPEVGEARARVLLGQVNAVAVAAATRAGHACDLMVPLDRGEILFPTLGLASFGASAGDAAARARFDGHALRITAGSRTIAVPADYRRDAPGWLGLRQVTAEADGLRLRLDLDDIGPFRGGTNPPPADRLDAAGFARWSRLVERAWHVLVTANHDRAETTAEITTTLIPLAAGGNAASRDAFGAVYFGPAADGPDLAEILVHECQHAKLNALLDLVALYVPSGDLHYSPARDDPRPIGGALHGCYALAGVADFWRQRRDVARNHAHLQFSFRLNQVLRSAGMLYEAGQLTAHGRDFLSTLIARLADWNSEPVPEEQRGWGEAMARDHYLRWRLHNVRHAETNVRRAADAWRRHEPTAPSLDPIVPTITPRPVGDVPSGREQLRNLQALTPDRLDAAVPRYGADMLYVRGDYAAAAQRYLEQLADDPDDTEHWAGLALATAELPPGRDLDALLERPELVYAIHRAVRDDGDRPPDPWELARWLTSSYIVR